MDSPAISTVLTQYSFVSENEASCFILALFPSLIRINNDVNIDQHYLSNEKSKDFQDEKKVSTEVEQERPNCFIFQCQSSKTPGDELSKRCKFHIRLSHNNITESMFQVTSSCMIHCDHCTHHIKPSPVENDISPSLHINVNTKDSVVPRKISRTERIPYVSADTKEPVELVEAIRKRRRGTLLHLDRMLLHSPPFAHGWNTFLQNVRENLSVDSKLKEICICIVAVLNKAEYEFLHHAPELLKAGGSETEVQALKCVGELSFPWHIFNLVECHVIVLTICMTRTIHVPESVLSCLRHLVGNQAAVELVGVVATYNMVSRFLVALGVTPDEHILA